MTLVQQLPSTKQSVSALTFAVTTAPSLPSGAGVASNRGIYAGKYYWEATIQGHCAYIGVGDETYNSSIAPGFDAHSWALGDVRSVGSVFFNSSVFGTNPSPWFTSSPNSVIIGIALDASSGRIWFRKDSEWIGGAPDTGVPSLYINAKYQYLYPVFGLFYRDTDYCSPLLPSITANFGATPFAYPVPNGFLRLQTSDCDCSSAYKACLEGIDCTDLERYNGAVQLYLDSCAAGNCTKSGKSICKNTYISCQNSVSNSLACLYSKDGCQTDCDCLRSWYDCMVTINCSFNNSDFDDYRTACIRLGCFERCDPSFKTPCNISTALCTTTYISCQLLATDRVSSCRCLSDLNGCIQSKSCWNTSELLQFARLCVDRSCSASECGFSGLIADQTKYIWCTTSVKVGCQSAFSDCLAHHTVTADGQTDLASDRCYINYNLSSIPIDERLQGSKYCQDVTKGGINGCSYYADQDICSTPSTCSCVGSFYSCMDTGGCIKDVDRDSYANTCDQIGCTAQQCGLSFSLCNESSINVCGKKYLLCEENVQSYRPILATFGSQNANDTCYSAYCLGHWAQCLNFANCSSPISLTPNSLNPQQCSSTLGCSLQSCSVSLAPDSPVLPDSPIGLQITSILGGKLLVTWLDSYLAVKWALTDSANSLISYQVYLSQTSGANLGIIRKVSLESGPPYQILFEGLTVGTIYTVLVSSRNLFGKSPALSASERLNGPPSVPLQLTLYRAGALRANLSWLAPLDFGDTTQNRPLLYYFVMIRVTPRRPYNEPYNVNVNITSLTFSFGSEYVPLNVAPIMAGDVVSASVAAVNVLSLGPFTPSENVQLMGLPSSIQILSTLETLSGVIVNWTLPRDTGFGFPDSSLILQSIVQISPSVDFDSSNTSTASIVVKSASACKGLLCTFLIDSARYTFVEETYYFLRIFAVNEVGYRADNTAAVITQGWRIKSPPSVPQFVRLSRRANVPLQAELTWTTPANTGDGTQFYTRFAGYVIQVSVLSSGGINYQISVTNTTSLLRIGVLQVGDTQISNSGAISVLAISVSSGSVIQVRVAARNDRGISDFIEPSPIMMMDVPSAVQYPAAVEQTSGIFVTWQTPLDTGFGSAGRLQIKKYEISVCSRSATTGSGKCDVSTFDQNDIASSRNEISFDVGYSFLIPSSVLGIQGIKYYINIFAWNDVGEGAGVCPTFCLGQSPGLGILLGWKILPTIQYPKLSATNRLQIAEYQSATTIWEIQSGLNFAVIPIAVNNFPLQPVPSTLLVPVTKGDDVVSVLVTINSIITDFMTNKADETGLDDTVNFGFKAPVFGTGSGSANGIISTAKYPAKVVSIPMFYFLYPDTQLIQISPSNGPTSGGFRMAMMFLEPLGFKTRAGAGITTIFDANLQDITVTVQGSSATVISRQSNPSGQAYNVYLVVLMPPGDNTILSTISILIAGASLKVSSAFQYRDAYVILVSPAAGLTTGQFYISIMMGGISGADQFSGTVTIQILNLLCIGASIVSVTQNNPLISGFADTQVVVAGITPTFPNPQALLPGQGFQTDIIVTIQRNDGSSLIVKGPNVLRLFVPNTPVISSFIIQATSIKIPFSQPTLILIQVQFLRIDPGVAVQVVFGYPQYNFVGQLAGCGQAICSCTNPCSLFQGGLQDNYQTTIRVYTPNVPAFQPFATLGVSIFVNGTVVASGRSVDFFDPGAAQIISVQPSELRGSGGTILLVAVTGFCDISCPPSGFNASFGGQTGSLIGFVSFDSWLNADGAFGSLISIPQLATIRAGYRAADLKVVGNVKSFLATNSQISTNKIYLMYISTPSLPTRLGSVNMSVTAADDSSRFSYYTLSNFPSPSGSAQGTISPTQILLADLQQHSIGFEIFLQPFQLIYSSAEVNISLLSLDGSDQRVVPATYISISSSSSSGTFIRLTLPSCPNDILICIGGFLTVQIYPVSLPSNLASFKFELLDQISSQDPTPSTVYTAGNDLMQVVLVNFYVKIVLSTDFRIKIISGNGTAAFKQTPCPNTSPAVVSGTCSFVLNASSVTSDFLSQTTAVSFFTPQVPDLQGKGAAASGINGVATAQIIYVPTGQTSQVLSFVYIQTPSGQAQVLSLIPSQGSTLGNFIVSFKLTNFRKVMTILDLTVGFGNNVSSSVPVQVQSTGFLSGFTITSFSVLAPPFPPGNTSIYILNAGRLENAGICNFLFIDYSIAVLAYPVGPPWPQGDASISNIVFAGVSGLGQSVTSSAVSLGMFIPDVSNLAKPTLQSLQSTPDLTQLQILLPPLPSVNTSTLAQIILSFSLSGSKKSVILYFQYLVNGVPYVVSFTPANYYTDGGIPMSIEVANLPIPAIITNQQIMFGTGIIINATSITILPTPKRARITLIIPQSGIVQVVTPQIIIIQNSTSTLVPFPSPFSYTEPPQVTIQSFYPTRAAIRNAIQVSLTLQNFPGVNPSRLSDISIQFGTAKLDGVVVSFTRLDTSKPLMAVQDIVVLVSTPIVTESDTAYIRASHLSYPVRLAISSSKFSFFDPSLPSFLYISSGISGPDQSKIYVKSSTAGRVVLVVQNVPLSNKLSSATSSDDIPIYIGGNLAIPTSFQMNSARQANIVLLTSAAAPQDVTVSLQFGSDTSTNFQDVPIGFTLSFVLRYYDDTVPILNYIVPTSGSELGGFVVVMSLSNFPAVATFQDALISLALPGSILPGPIYADIVGIQNSDLTSTVLKVRMPAVNVASGVLDVQISVQSTINEKKITGSLSFRYFDVAPSITSVYPTTGTSLGGATVNLQIANFASNQLPLSITFQASSGSTFLQQGSGLVSITVDALGNNLYLTLLTPPSSAGVATIIIYSLVSGPSQAVQFNFQVVDASSPVLDLPFPTTACIQDVGKAIYIYLRQATSPQSLDAIAKKNATVQFGQSASPVMVADISQVSNGRVRLSVILPSYGTPVSYSLYVTFGVYSLIQSIPFSITDCSVPGILSVNPSVVLNIGGNAINVVLQNVPPLDSNQLAVSFGDQARVDAASVRSSRNSISSLTYLTIFAPALTDIVGDLNVTISFSVPGNTTKVLKFLINVQTPCDFNLLCSQSGKIVAVHLLRSNPPASQLCLPSYAATYCTSAQTVPLPSLISFSPTQGLIGQLQIITAQISSFSALLMDTNYLFQTRSAISIQAVISGQNRECPLLSLNVDGNSFFSQISTFTFSLPTDTDIQEGPVKILLSASYGTTGTSSSVVVTRSVSSYYTFIRPVSGALSVQDFYPTQCLPSECPTTEFTIVLGNFPYYAMSAPFDVSNIKTVIGGFVGLVSSIIASSRSSTTALFTLPSGLNYSRVNSTFDVQIVYTPFGMQLPRCLKIVSSICLDRAAVTSILILPPLVPVVLDFYPDTLMEGAGVSDLLVYVTIGYAPRNLQAIDWQARLKWFQSASVQTSENLLIVDAEDISDETCTADSCSLSSITLQAPPQISAFNNQATVEICLKASPATCVQNALKYSTYLVFVDPTSVEVTSDFDPNNFVDVYVDGFTFLLSSGCTQVDCSISPVDSCTCSQLQISCNLLTDCVVQPRINAFENGDTFYMSVALPRPRRLGVITFTVSDNSDRQKAPVHFDVEYLQPSPIVLPSDGPSGKGTPVSVTVYWGSVRTPITVKILGSSASVSVKPVDIFEAYSIVNFTIPPAAAIASAAGILSISLTSSDQAIATCNFEVFDAPVVVSLQPSQGTVDGRVGECTTCLANADGNTISIWVENFPFVEDDDFETISVTFGSLLCDGSDNSCDISSIQTLLDPVSGVQLVYVTVTVPPAPRGFPTAVTVFVQYIPADSIASSVRVASAVFTYVTLPIVFNWVALCTVCSNDGPCLNGGVCGDGSDPIVYSSTYPQLRIPLQGNITATASIQNFPQFQINLDTNAMILPAGCKPTDLCGLSLDPPSFGTVRQALLSTVDNSIIEFVFQGSTQLSLDASVRIRTSIGGDFSVANFAVAYYDSKVQVRLLTSQGPFEGGYQVRMSVSNFITLDSSINFVDSIMSITFGDQSANGLQVSQIQNEGLQYNLLIPVPSYSCATCAISNGVAVVPVAVQATGNPLLSASSTFAYIQAPQILTARFNLAGTGLDINFNEETDRAGFSQSLTSCSYFLNTSLLGSNPTCLWSTNSLLQVFLGDGTTVVPGSSISILENIIRSKGGVSSYSIPQPVIVLSPLIVQKPAPISIKGPSEIDSCSDLSLVVSVPSPRPLTFYWSCADSTDLSRLLQGSGSNVFISSILLSRINAWSDKVFTISVYAIDFLGSKSDVVSIQVKRKSTPSPQISFFGNSIYSPQQDILVRGEAAFSSCKGSAQSQMVFKWTSNTGPNIQVIDFNKLGIRTDSPQLFIRSSTLPAGKQFSLTLTVSLSSDKSKSSQKIFAFSTSQSALVAKLSGGNALYVSASSSWKLDGSSSIDPDKDPSNITFAWACSFNNGNGLVQSCVASNGKQISMPGVSVLSYPSGILPASPFPYLFTLTVSKPKRTSSSASVSVYVTSLIIPQLGIQQNFTAWTPQGIPQVSTSDRIRLAGFSPDSEITRFVWFVQYGSNNTITLPDTAVPLGYSNMNFVLNVGQSNLVPGITYTVIVQGVAAGSNAQGQASIQFAIIQPPQSGVCTACKYSAGASSSSSCITVGTALLDTFRISCTGWADVNQPLKYRFGLRTSVGDDWFDYVPDNFKDMKLSSGKVGVLSMVVNSLGAATGVIVSSITVNPIAAGNRRLLDPAYKSALDQVVAAINTAYLAGRCDTVNQISFSFSSELDSSVNSSRLTSVDASFYKQNLTLSILQSMSIAILTVGYAEETSTSISHVVHDPAQLTETTILSSVRVVNQLSAVDTRGNSMSTSLVSNVIEVIDATACSLNGVCVNTSQNSLSFKSIWQWMNVTRDTSSRVMNGLLTNVFNGEPAVTFGGRSSSFSSAKSNLNLLQLNGLGQGQSFTLLATDTITVNAYTSFSLIPDVVRSKFNVSSRSFAGLSLSIPLGNLQGASKSVTIRIPIDPKVSFLGQNQTYNINSFICAWWDGATGRMNPSGCQTSNVNATMVECTCDHLTEFAITDTGNRSLVTLQSQNNGSNSCINGKVLSSDGYCSCYQDWFGSSCSIHLIGSQYVSSNVSFTGSVSNSLAFSLPSGEKLTIPQGSIDYSDAVNGLTITMVLYSLASLPLAVNQSLTAQQAFAGSFAMLFPSGLKFKIPVTLTLLATLPLPVQRKVSTFYYNGSASAWDIRESVLASVSGVIETNLSHFSTYAVISFPSTPSQFQSNTSTSMVPNYGTTTTSSSPSVTGSASFIPQETSTVLSSTPPPSATPAPTPGSSIPLIPIIAGVVGGVVVLAAVIAFFVIRRRNARSIQVRDFASTVHTCNRHLVGYLSH